jgi:hypothetical protein
MEPHRLRTIVISAVLIALAVALGFGLAHVPNVELITLVVFMSGNLLGRKGGLVVGAISMGLFTTLNPMGAPIVPVALAQVTAMAAVGALGGQTRFWVQQGPSWIKLALCGLVGTLFYDLTTNLALALSLGWLPRLGSILIAGLSFSALHVLSNVVIFAAAGSGLPALRTRFEGA